MLLGLVSRALGVPVRWTEDRLEHLAASAHATGRVDRARGRVRRGRRAARPALRRARGRRRLRARARAGDALPHARLAVRRLPRAQRRRAQARRADEPLSDGLNRGFGGPQLYFAARADDGLAARGSDRPCRAAAAQPRRASSPTRARAAAIYERATTRVPRQALELVRYDERRAEQGGGKAIGIGIACVVEPSVSNMGYITLAQTPDERAAGLPKSGNVEGCTITISPLGGISVRSRRRRRAGAPRRSPRRSWPTGSASRREDVDVLERARHVDEGVVGRLAARTRRASAASVQARGGVPPTSSRAKTDAAAIREHARPGESRSRRVAGMCALDPGVAAGGDGARAFGDRVLCRAEPAAARWRGRMSRRRANGFIVDIAMVEVERRDRRVTVLDYVTRCTTRDGC